MSAIQNYIQSRLDHLSTPVVFNKESVDLEIQLYHHLTTKKFRKYALPEGYNAVIRNIIHEAVKNQQPMNLVWVFGCYKLWSLKEAPTVDWAELFSLMYFVDWLKPIVQLHKPGIIFDFFSDDVIIPIMNHVPQNDVTAYVESFKTLLKFIVPYLPKGFSFQFHRVINRYESFDHFLAELNQNIQTLTDEREKNFALTTAQIAMIDLNVIPNEKQQSDLFWRQKVQIIHDAYSMSSKRRPYYRNSNKIMVVNTAVNGAIAVGTTKASVAKFWVGAGALEKKGDSFTELVLSPSQIQTTQFDTITIRMKGLEGKNFSRIKLKTQ